MDAVTVPLYDPPEPEPDEYVQTFGTGSISTVQTDDEDPPVEKRRLPFGFQVRYADQRYRFVRNRHRNSVPRRHS